MYVIRTTLATTLCCLAVLSACSNNATPDADPFATMQLCFDEHHGVEALSVNDAIVVCCLDHPIAGVHPSCGDTALACTGRLEGTDAVGRLTQTADVTPAAIMAACQDYISKKGM